MRDRLVAAWTRGPGWRWPTLLAAVDIRLDGDRQAAHFGVFRGDDGRPAIHITDPCKRASAHTP